MLRAIRAQLRNLLVVMLLLSLAGLCACGQSSLTESVDEPQQTSEQESDSEAEEQAHKDSLAVEKAELTSPTKTLEYSKKETDLLKSVTCSDKDVQVKLVKNVDLSKLGKQTAVFALSKGDSSREVELDYEVVDTHMPEIKLEKDKVELQNGASYDPTTNVKDVSDSVDGALKRVETEPKDNGAGWYVVQGTVNTGVAGDYPVKVVACDNHGNSRNKSFTVHVAEAPAAAAAAATAAPEAEPAAELAPEPAAEETEPAESGGGDNPFSDQGLPPATSSYVLNTNSKKFHEPSCPSVAKMKAKNRRDVDMAREDIIAQGYEPCQNCNP